MVDIRQSPNYAKYLKSQGWKVEKMNDTYYFLKKMPLIGYFLKIQRPKEIDFKTIKKLQKKYRVFQTVVEPDLNTSIRSSTDSVAKGDYHRIFLSHGYKLSKSAYLPTKTLHLNLNQSIEKIKNSFSKETRRCIRRGERSEIKQYSTPNELKKFREAWKKSVKFNRYVPSTQSLINLRKAFPKNYSLFLASHNMLGKIIGGAVFTRSKKDFSYYWYGFTCKEGRSSLSQYSLLYQGILWGKGVGCKMFDFEGVYDERFPNKSWLGFTDFKIKFGGIKILYPGCHTLLEIPILR